eukprot:RCo031421
MIQTSVCPMEKLGTVYLSANVSLSAPCLSAGPTSEGMNGGRWWPAAEDARAMGRSGLQQRGAAEREELRCGPFQGAFIVGKQDVIAMTMGREGGGGGGGGG